MTSYYTIQTLQGLSSDRSMLSCTPDGKVDLWKKDDGSGRQRWVLTPLAEQVGPHGVTIYVLSVYEGVASADAIYLAWDGSGTVGLQAPVYGPGGWGQWVVEPVQANAPPPSDFYIRTYGTPHGKPSLYLSCSEDGTVVDLSDADDGSGRQRWQMQGPVYDGSPPRPSPFN